VVGATGWFPGVHREGLKDHIISSKIIHIIYQREMKASACEAKQANAPGKKEEPLLACGGSSRGFSTKGELPLMT